MSVFARCIGVAAAVAGGVAATDTVDLLVALGLGSASGEGIDRVVCAAVGAFATPAGCPASSFLTLSIICCVSNGLSMWSSTWEAVPLAASNGFCFDERSRTGVVGKSRLISLQSS